MRNRNPVKNSQPSADPRACRQVTRKAVEIATDAHDKIEALARAHFAKCTHCQVTAAEQQIRSLQYNAREALECGGVF